MQQSSKPGSTKPGSTFGRRDRVYDQYDAINGHTDFYLHTLGQYLAHCNRRRATYVGQPSSGIEGPAATGQSRKYGLIDRVISSHELTRA